MGVPSAKALASSSKTVVIVVPVIATTASHGVVLGSVAPRGVNNSGAILLVYLVLAVSFSSAAAVCFLISGVGRSDSAGGEVRI